MTSNLALFSKKAIWKNCSCRQGLRIPHASKKRCTSQAGRSRKSSSLRVVRSFKQLEQWEWEQPVWQSEGWRILAWSKCALEHARSLAPRVVSIFYQGRAHYLLGLVKMLVIYGWVTGIIFSFFFSDLPDFYCRGIFWCSPGVQFSACLTHRSGRSSNRYSLKLSPRRLGTRADWSKIAVTKMTMGLDYEKGDHTVLQHLLI